MFLVVQKNHFVFWLRVRHVLTTLQHRMSCFHLHSLFCIHFLFFICLECHYAFVSLSSASLSSFSKKRQDKTSNNEIGTSRIRISVTKRSLRSFIQCKEELLSWTLSNNNHVDILPSTVGHGNGLFVTKSILKHEIIMTIPSNKTISIEDAWEDLEMGDAFMYLTDIGGPGAKLATLAGFVAKEVGLNTLFVDNKTTTSTSIKSKWKPYLDCLPMNWQDHVLWWSNDKVERLLKGSNVYEEVLSMREQVDIAIENLVCIFWNHYTNMEDDVSHNDNQEREKEMKIFEERLSTLVRSAFCAILSRAFEDEDFDCMKLIPVLDMTQHCSSSDNDDDDGVDVNIIHETDTSTGNIVVRAKRDLSQGEELFNCYSTSLAPHQFFTVFGFVPNTTNNNNNNNKTVLELLEEKDPIFFPG